MKALTKKMTRSIRKTKGQFLAMVAVVAVGVSLYISMSTAFFNLTLSRDAFYRETDFADYFFHVIKAPQSVIRQVEGVPGVLKASGRIQEDVPIFKDEGQRATARLTSIGQPLEYQVNRIHLLTGRIYSPATPGGGVEVVVDPQYAAANKLKPGDTVTIGASGRQVSLRMVGTAANPEFVYAIKDAATLVPDPLTFGILMISTEQAQQILNLPGQINQVVVRMVPGVDQEAVAQKIKDILAPYGNLASYPQKQQLSNTLLQGELDGLAASSRFIPVIFLGLAAAIQFILLRRMIKHERAQIGVLKALGYYKGQIMRYYTGYALAVTVTGTFWGLFLGLIFASYFSAIYAQFFNLPRTIGSLNTQAVLNSLILSGVIGIGAGLSAARQVLAIQPAESMRPEPPKSSKTVLLEKLPGLWNLLDSGWRMGLRTAARNKFRFAMVVCGMIASVAMLLLAFFTNDAVYYMLDQHFYREIHYNYQVRFDKPVKEAEAGSITRLSGVQKAEAMMEVPIKIHYAGKSEDDIVLAVPHDAKMNPALNKDGREIEIPEQGLVVSEQRSKKLGLAIGDTVVVESTLGLGPNHFSEMKIVGVNRKLIGSQSYCSLTQANKLLGESGVISGLVLLVDPGQAVRFEEEVGTITGVAAISSREKELNSFTSLMGSTTYMLGIMFIFAFILGFAIIYNTSQVSFMERAREMASLRVIGFTSREVSGLLLKETLLQSVVGVILGMPLGRAMITAYINSAQTDIYSFSVVIYPGTYVFADLSAAAFIMAGHLMTVRGVKRLDLVEALKSRE